MRPAEPVPATRERSTLFSLAILRTSGEDRPCSAAAATDAAGAGAGAAAGVFAGAGAAAAGAGAALVAAPPMTATTVLMLTVVPSETLISVRVPAAGEGISASTLSVEISNRGS